MVAAGVECPSIPACIAQAACVFLGGRRQDRPNRDQCELRRRKNLLVQMYAGDVLGCREKRLRKNPPTIDTIVGVISDDCVP